MRKSKFKSKNIRADKKENKNLYNFNFFLLNFNFFRRGNGRKAYR